jgi:hypothetical protein
MPVEPPGNRYGRNPLESLSAAERVICGRLVLRQLHYGGPRIERALKKYGPEGTVRLCSARVFSTVEVAFALVGVVLAFSGHGLAFGCCFIVVFVAAALGAMRFASAGIAGKRWRSTR